MARLSDRKPQADQAGDGAVGTRALGAVVTLVGIVCILMVASSPKGSPIDQQQEQPMINPPSPPRPSSTSSSGGEAVTAAPQPSTGGAGQTTDGQAQQQGNDAAAAPPPQSTTTSSRSGEAVTPTNGGGSGSDGVWMRGTGGRLSPGSACIPIPSLGFWRVRCYDHCSKPNPGPRTAVIDFATPVTGLAARCDGPGCSGKRDLKVRQLDVSTGGPAAAKLEVDFGDCTDWDRPGKTAAYRDADVKFDVYASDDDASQGAKTCFLSVGDWGKGGSQLARVSSAMKNTTAEDTSVRFIMSTGDNFYPTGVRSADDPQFKTAFEDPFNSDELKQMLWFVCAGNHDQWGIDGQIAYSVTGPARPSSKLPYSERWYFPSRAYSNEIPLSPNVSARLITLDTFGRKIHKQAAFLASEAKPNADLRRQTTLARDAREKAKGDESLVPVDLAWESGAELWRLVNAHSPLFSGSGHGQNPAETGPIRELFKPYIDAGHVQGWFSGHDHVLEVHRSAKTDYFVSGGGGGSSIYQSKAVETTLYSNNPGDLGFMRHCFDGRDGLSVMRTYVHRTDDQGGSTVVHTQETPVA